MLIPKEKKDELTNESEMYYKNLANGTANYDDFERYIYGRNFNQKSSDETDKVNEKARKFREELMNPKSK